ncbi:O-antigen ligase family protein [Dictyobacter arantiisoli]|uniref:Uncharacterized protein n=1 Tax=Dictyobacter arantiisoli TaxID=2014874 RepID=A0A5A5T6T0_9CHLR|nr:O-antigen ligase family protein [Dictyobacter arantiisoli]GCF06886.1 hypothetical protein KDI_04500 [Dictyobacter arantiisoli]
MYRGTSIGHYATLLYRYFWLIGLVVLLCTGTTYVINYFMVPVYEATALLEVHDASTNGSNIFSDQALAQSEALLINRPDVLQAVTQKIPAITVQQLQKQVSDSPLNNTPIIQVCALAESPTQATRLANTVVTTFIQLQNTHITQQLKIEARKIARSVQDAKQQEDNAQEQLINLQTLHASAARIAQQNDTITAHQINYNALQTSYNQIQQQLLQSGNILTIVQMATPPTTPVSPRIVLNTLAAAALSLLMMVVFVLVWDWMNTTIKTVDDVEALAQLSALGSIPCVKEGEKKTHDQLPLVNIEPVEQAFSTISTNLAMRYSEAHALLVTSLSPRAGTSTTAINLALALARTGSRVLLIDGNLKRGTLHSIFKHPNNYGLTNVLTESELFQEGPNANVAHWLNQQKTSIANLWFLPTGPLPKQKASILRTPGLPIFLKCLVQPPSMTFDSDPVQLIDIIIIDAAPLEDGPDCGALASCTDSAIIVIEAGKEQAKPLQKASKILQRLYSPVQGVVINRQKPHHQSYLYINQHNDPGVEKGASYPNKEKLRIQGPWLVLLGAFLCAGLPALQLPIPGHTVRPVELVLYLSLSYILLFRPTCKLKISHVYALLFFAIALISFLHVPEFSTRNIIFGANKRVYDLALLLLALFCGTFLAPYIRSISTFFVLVLLSNLPVYGICLLQAMGYSLPIFLVTNTNPALTGDKGRLVGPFDGAATLGIYMTGLFAVALSCWLLSKRRRDRRIGAIMTLGTLLVIVGSGTRSALAATGAMLCLAFIFTRRYKLFAGVAILSIGGFIIFRDGIFSLFTHAATSTTNRLFLWHEAIKLIIAHPILGIGMEQFHYYYQRLIISQATQLNEHGISIHNQYLEWAMESGILWLILGVGFFLSLFFTCMHAYRHMYNAASLRQAEACLPLLATMLAVCATMSISCLDVPFDTVEIGSFLCLLAGIALSNTQRPAQPEIQISQNMYARQEDLCV